MNKPGITCKLIEVLYNDVLENSVPCLSMCIEILDFFITLKHVSAFLNIDLSLSDSDYNNVNQCIQVNKRS